VGEPYKMASYGAVITIRRIGHIMGEEGNVVSDAFLKVFQALPLKV